MVYTLRLDYATFNFDAGSINMSKVGEILCGTSDLCWKRFGKYETSPCQSPYGLYWREDSGYSERPHMLQVSGVGCEKFELTLPVLRKFAPCHFSRLDFAFDVIQKREDWRKYIKRVFAESLDSDRQAKCFKLQGSGEAMTVYIGSRRSERFFRIYNKTLEDSSYQFVDSYGNVVPLDDDECVIRYEIEFHKFRRTLRGETQFHNV